MGIDASAGVQPGHAGAAVELAAEVERLVHLCRAFADANRKHSADASLISAGEHGRAVFGVALAVEMGVRIDQQVMEPPEWSKLRNWATARPRHRRLKPGLGLLQPSADGYFFEESSEHRGAVGQGCSQQHAVRFEAAHLARSQIGDDDDFAPDQLFRLVVLRDASENLALFIAKVDFKTK